LGEEIDKDRRAGLRPFLVVSTAGTTNTGAVDPLDAIADLCERAGLWHHVDGAYGAFFHVVEPLRPLLAGLPRADSLSLDPHKGLFLPYLSFRTRRSHVETAVDQIIEEAAAASR
jgi:aromatic-L-amino-acid decarboxylase